MIAVFILLCSLSIKGYKIRPDNEMLLPEVYCGSKNLVYHDHTPFSYILEEPDICTGEVYLLTYVQSSSSNFDKRKMIRDTWGSLRSVGKHPVRLIFVVGNPADSKTGRLIIEESQAFRDIVQADFVDSYYNLTLKHIVALHWIQRFCSHAKFVSKTDDDTFINIFQLVFHLNEKFSSTSKFILGQISYNELPIRKKGSKWKVSLDLYPDKKYPPYAKGFAYVISQDSIKPLYICSYYKKFFFIDDIFLTGFISKLTNVTLVNFERFYESILIRKENITVDMVRYLFVVSQYEYYPKKWKYLWKVALLTMDL